MKIVINADEEATQTILAKLVETLTVEIVEELRCLNGKIDHLSERQEQIWRKEKAMNQETIAILGRIDTATNTVAAKLKALIDKASSAGSVTEAEVRAALEPQVARLEALGADPADPVPTV